MDDVQRIFKMKDCQIIQEFIINSILLPIRDNNEASIFIVTSDYSIEEELRLLSGMSTRMKIFPFPKLDKKDFEDLMKKDLEHLQKINNKITLESLLQFYDDFGADLRSLDHFIPNYKGNYEGDYEFFFFQFL